MPHAADRGYRGDIIEEVKHDFEIDVEITHSNYSGQFVPAKKNYPPLTHFR